MIETDITRAAERAISGMRLQIEAAAPGLTEMNRKAAYLSLDLLTILHRFRAAEGEAGRDAVAAIQIVSAALGNCAASVLGSFSPDLEHRRVAFRAIASDILMPMMALTGDTLTPENFMVSMERAEVYHG